MGVRQVSQCREEDEKSLGRRLRRPSHTLEI